jgi:hypothetical protein
MKDRLSQAYHLATEAAQKAREKLKGGYDIRIRGAAIKPGDRVLVKVVSFDGQVVNRNICVGLAHYNIRILFPSVYQLMFAIKRYNFY